MPEGPLGGPRPGASNAATIVVGFETLDVSEAKIDDAEEDSQFISALIDMMEVAFGLMVQSKDVSTNMTSVRIQIEDPSIFRLYRLPLGRGSGKANNVEELVGFMEGQIGKVASVSIEME